LKLQGVFGRKTQGISIEFSKGLIQINFKFVKPIQFVISIPVISILLVGFSTIFLIKPAAAETSGIKVDSTQYSVYVGHPAQVKITGKITGAAGGNVILTIIKPDGTSQENMAFVTKIGDFTSLILLDKNSQLGHYQISAHYNGAYVGSTSFDVTGKESQQTTTPQPATEYKTYQNTQYGFSIKHPSWWQEQEVLQKTSQGVLIVVLAPSKATFLVIAIAPNDKDFEGLQGQEYLNKMIESQKKDCNPPSCSNFKVGESNTYTHANGYLEYVLVYSVSQRAADGTTSDVVRIIAQIPNDKDTWLLLIQTTADELKQHLAEISSVTSTFTIFDYQKPTITPTKIVTYQNSKYGFSIKHPSNWSEKELNLQIPEGTVLLAISSPDSQISMGVLFRPNDNVYGGLEGQNYFDKMIENYKNSCKMSFQRSGSTCSDFNVIGSGKDKTDAGYETYGVSYTTQQKNPDGTNEQLMYIVGQIPDGNDTWVLVFTGSPNAVKLYSDDIKTIAYSFAIFDYNGATSTTLQSTPLLKQKQFQLYAKASQKNDVVYLVIKNTKDSSDDIYSIKLTTVNGKITNLIKIKDWNYMRLGPNSIMYQTTSSPLHSSGVIQVKLKVDSKNTEIQWEAFTKDQKSLGTGKVGTS